LGAVAQRELTMSALHSFRSFRELYFLRLRGFYRSRPALFWVCVFPTLSAIGMGLAFHNRPEENIRVDLVRNAASDWILSRLRESRALEPRLNRFALELTIVSRERADERLRNSDTHLVVEVGPDSGEGRPSRVTYRFLSSRPNALTARTVFDDALQRTFQRRDPLPTRDEAIDELGTRYIDFVIAGLIAMNTMGNSFWGVGFIVTYYRTTQLMKRFRATPMRRHSFLLAILGVRLTFLVPEVCLLLLSGVALYGLPIRGSLILFALIEVVGALAFSGLGLLLASRVRSSEEINGLINLVSMPMWLFSGVFFSSSYFPEFLQPAIRVLPLTQLVDAVRAVLLKGEGFSVVFPTIAMLAGWAVAAFVLVLAIFRWD
jgi:ABC-2 type transport system permease protein